jgi:hypothetical protein
MRSRQRKRKRVRVWRKDPNLHVHVIRRAASKPRAKAIACPKSGAHRHHGCYWRDLTSMPKPNSLHN